MSHGDNLQLFLVTFLPVTGQNFWVVAMSHGDNPQLFVLPFSGNKKKVESRRHDSRRRPSTFCVVFFWQQEKR